jgi:hypothetical protein
MSENEEVYLWDALRARAKADPQFSVLLHSSATELERLHNLINSPHIADFMEAVKLEGLHQRERWAVDHDAGKTDADWFWLIGHLAGKALNAGTQAAAALATKDASMEAHYNRKRLHHVITAAAALLNWHAALTGTDTRMRPGIASPEKA